MLHQYKLNGYNIVLDTCSGSVHQVDEVAYDVIAMYPDHDKEEIIETLLEKYKDQMASIIGHFGLGFYSAFMVAKKVTIETLSWQEGAKAVKWTCDGSPEYTLEPCKKDGRGTVITLHIEDDSTEFATKSKISE